MRGLHYDLPAIRANLQMSKKKSNVSRISGRLLDTQAKLFLSCDSPATLLGTTFCQKLLIGSIVFAALCIETWLCCSDDCMKVSVSIGLEERVDVSDLECSECMWSLAMV